MKKLYEKFMVEDRAADKARNDGAGKRIATATIGRGEKALAYHSFPSLM